MTKRWMSWHEVENIHDTAEEVLRRRADQDGTQPVYPPQGHSVADLLPYDELYDDPEVAQSLPDLRRPKVG